MRQGKHLIGTLFMCLAAAPALASDKPASPQTAVSKAPVRARPQVPGFPADVKIAGDRMRNGASAAVKAWAAEQVAKIANGPGDPETLARTAAHTRWPNLHVAAAYDALAFIAIYEAADSLRSNLKKKLDSMAEFNEAERVRLEMLADRLRQMMTTLSVLLGKVTDTAESIIQNLK